MTGPSTASRRADAALSRRLSGYGQGLRWCFAVLLLAGALGKLTDMHGFTDVVASYRVLPGVWVAVAAWALAFCEAGFALWLMSERQLRSAALGVTLLHCVYFGWIALALARGLQLTNCGCFGVYWPRPLTPWSLVEDGALLIAAWALFLAAERTRQSA